MEQISLRKFGYKMSDPSDMRHNALDSALSTAGVDAVLKRLEYIKVNKTFLDAVESDIAYVATKTETVVADSNEPEDSNESKDSNDLKNSNIDNVHDDHKANETTKMADPTNVEPDSSENNVTNITTINIYCTCASCNDFNLHKTEKSKLGLFLGFGVGIGIALVEIGLFINRHRFRYQ